MVSSQAACWAWLVLYRAVFFLGLDNHQWRTYQRDADEATARRSG